MSDRMAVSLTVRSACLRWQNIQISSHWTCGRMTPCRFYRSNSSQCFPAHSSCRSTLGMFVPMRRQIERTELPSTISRRIVFRFSMLITLAISNQPFLMRLARGRMRSETTAFGRAAWISVAPVKPWRPHWGFLLGILYPTAIIVVQLILAARVYIKSFCTTVLAWTSLSEERR